MQQVVKMINEEKKQLIEESNEKDEMVTHLKSQVDSQANEMIEKDRTIE